MRSPSSRLTAGIAVALAISAAITGALYVVSSAGVETVWFHDGRLLRLIQGADSWKPMELARAYARTHATGLYQQVFFTDHVKFQYPPTALLAFGSLERPSLNLISWLATVFTAGLAVPILRRSLAAERIARVPGPASLLALDAVVVIAALTFYPLLKAYSLGQLQAWINLLFALLMLAWLAGARAAAGVMLGAMCLLKPTYALLFIWAGARRQWRFVAAGGAVLAAGVAVSLWRYGLADHLDYLRVLAYIGRRGEAFYANQSFNGALNRLFSNGASLDWHYEAFAPVHPWVSTGTTAAFLGLGAAALRRPRQDAGSALDLSIAALALTMTSPLGWEHTYGILVPVYAAVLPVVIRRRPLGRWTAAALAASYIVSAGYFQFTNRFAATPLNPLQSYLLAAALLLWLLLWRTAHQSPNPQAQRGPEPPL